MLAGIVEVSNLLITQNRVTTSSRMAAGYGAANFDRGNWANAGGTAEDMGIVALNTISDSMPLNTDQWDIYSAHGLTNQEGTDFDVFESEWVYGVHNVVTDAEWIGMEADIKAQILDSLQAECPGDPASCAGNIEFVVSVPFHNLDTILGIPVWQWVGFQRVRGMTVMRIRPEVEAAGCAILPIAVRLNQWSLYPSNWPAGTPEGAPLYFPGDPVDLFPQGTKPPDGYDLPKKDGDNNKQTPNPPPTYLNNEIAPNLDTDTFVRNTPGITLKQAIAEDDRFSGAIFWARDFTSSGNLGWLSWDGSTAQPDLEASIDPPGNFVEVYPGSNADLSVDDKGDPLRSFETGDADGWLERGEWIESATGNMDSISSNLYYPYVYEGREVGIIVFSRTDEEGGANRMYEAFDFITVRILGFSFDGVDKWIVFEFISADLVCGPDDAG
jgi:hypothetical protein